MPDDEEYTQEDAEMAQAEEQADRRQQLGPLEQLIEDRRASDRYERWWFRW